MDKGLPYNYTRMEEVEVTNIEFFFSEDFFKMIEKIDKKTKRGEYFLYISRGNFRRLSQTKKSLANASSWCYNHSGIILHYSPFPGKSEAMLLGLNIHFDLSKIK